MERHYGRNVTQPDVISKYFARSNVVDLFNQSRQFDLELEKHWVTEDGFFRLVTTLFGIIVIDYWNLMSGILLHNIVIRVLTLMSSPN